MKDNIFGKIIPGLIGLYIIVASMIFAPLYNWRYARENGVVKWIFLGEIVATAKAIIWPYYVFAAEPKTNDTDYPKLSADESDALSRIISKAQIEPLTDNDISNLKNVLKAYNDRTGTKIKKSDVNDFIRGTKIINDYYYELGQSLLSSWDTKSKITTSNFDKVLQLVKEYGLRKPKKIKMDLVALDAAARNQNYVEDQQGRKFEFGREVIIQKLRENEIARKNFDQIKDVFYANSR